MTAENNPNQYGFIPKRLEVPGSPELSVFPQNILFAVFYSQRGQKMAATALYLPATYRQEESSLVYKNLYDPKDIAFVTISHSDNWWQGVKTINGRDVLRALDTVWERFFGEFTGHGLSKGEPCMFEPLPKK